MLADVLLPRPFQHTAKLVPLRFQHIAFAIKANPHPGLLRALVDEGFGLECVSLGELEHVFAVLPALDPKRAEIRYHLACVLRKLGEEAAARAALAEALERVGGEQREALRRRWRRLEREDDRR